MCPAGMTLIDSGAHKLRGRGALARLRDGDTAPMADWLREHLFEQVLPFWEPLIDQDLGGVFTCVTDRGEIVSREKWLWSQWRAVWVFSRIYNSLDPSDRWRDRAEQIARFCVKHGRIEGDVSWALLLDEKGAVKRGGESIYVDAFAVYGLVELAAATGDRSWLALAVETADRAIVSIRTLAEKLPHFPYLIWKGGKPHGVPMIWSIIFAGLAVASGDQKYAEFAIEMTNEVWTDFYDKDTDRVVETVKKSGGLYPGSPGEVTLPGHVIEGLWFQRLITAQLGRETHNKEETWRVMARHFDLGWEQESGGGLLLAVNQEGQPVPTEAWPFGETKLWWPQTEALFATLLGWHEMRDSEWLDRYESLWEVCWAHYVDWEHGEWRQKLGRDFSPLTETIALPVKDPFHLPRSLIMQIELLENKTPPRVATVLK